MTPMELRSKNLRSLRTFIEVIRPISLTGRSLLILNRKISIQFRSLYSSCKLPYLAIFGKPSILIENFSFSKLTSTRIKLSKIIILINTVTNNIYLLFSTSDHEVFPNSEVNVKRLGDWNKRFQSCIKKLNTFTLLTPLQERLAVNLDLMHLAQDFIYAATTYGKIIISEYYLPRSKKTIKPCSELPGVSPNILILI